MENFKIQLAKLNLVIKEVSGDGNCLFRSISDQMEGHEHAYDTYRQGCVFLNPNDIV